MLPPLWSRRCRASRIRSTLKSAQSLTRDKNSIAIHTLTRRSNRSLTTWTAFNSKSKSPCRHRTRGYLHSTKRLMTCRGKIVLDYTRLSRDSGLPLPKSTFSNSFSRKYKKNRAESRSLSRRRLLLLRRTHSLIHRKRSRRHKNWSQSSRNISVDLLRCLCSLSHQRALKALNQLRVVSPLTLQLCLSTLWSRGNSKSRQWSCSPSRISTWWMRSSKVW
jgi:hypothetical protein